jgi:MFS transporter, MHS family, shikimate and dehydroshikimate transport protein
VEDSSDEILTAPTGRPYIGPDTADDDRTGPGVTIPPAAEEDPMAARPRLSGAPKRSSMGAVAAAALAGSALEWYDYFLYGAAASLVFGKVIFPSHNAFIGTLAAFATLALGFAVRPLGGIFFGALGDRVGRKRVLVITLLLMGTATALIGVIPSYRSAGIWSPILLIVLRILQGLGAGAEFGGAAVLSAENAPPRRRGLYGAFPGVGVYVGLLLSAGVFAVATQLPKAAFLAWGWRIPFLASIVMVLVSLYVRMRVGESPAFEELEQQDAVARSPLKDLLRQERRGVLIVMGSQVAQSGVGYIYQTFAITYIVGTLAMAASVGPIGVAAGGAAAMVGTLVSGALSDRLGRKPVYLFGAGFSAVFAFPFFWLVGTKSLAAVIAAMMLGLGIGVASMLGAQGAFFAELFSTRVRISGLVFGREISAAVAGGFAPLIAVAVTHAVGGAFWPVALMTILMSAVTFAALLAAPETRDVDVTAGASAGVTADRAAAAGAAGELTGQAPVTRAELCGDWGAQRGQRFRVQRLLDLGADRLGLAG